MCSQIKTFLFFASSQLPNLLPNVKTCSAEQVPAAEREKQDVLFYLIHIIASPWEILLKDRCGFFELRETFTSQPESPSDREGCRIGPQQESQTRGREGTLINSLVSSFFSQCFSRKEGGGKTHKKHCVLLLILLFMLLTSLVSRC